VTTVAAVDLGATSVRVCRIDLDARPVSVDVVHRVPHAPVRLPDGSLRWDWERLVGAVRDGLDRAGRVDSIGVDTWAVDYGLVDADGNLLGAPHSYRSERTRDFERVIDRIGSRRLYEICGLQTQAFNTIFQLAAHDRDELDAAAHLLFLPDLVVHHLTGAVGTERTSAGSSGLYDLRAHDWSEQLIDASGAPRRLFDGIADAPSPAGHWCGIPVHRVGGHDTASAVVALPDATDATAFVATGTWLLVGKERDEPDTSPEAQSDNFTNEIGALGGIRFLKNVAGFWMLNECLRLWGITDAAPLLAAARNVDAGSFDATDASLLAPADMEAEVRRLAGLSAEAGREVVVASIVESMAATTARVIERLGDVRDVVVVGGGAHDEFLSERIAHHCGLPVRRGPVEAAAVGNALVQGIALGVFENLEDARRAL
jgi:rhamnulokinase